VRENCAANEVVVGDERVIGIRYSDQGVHCEARARFVIDASGNKSRIHHSVGGVRHYSEFFKNLALFGYFEGGKRLPEPNVGNILCEAFDSGWFLVYSVDRPADKCRRRRAERNGR
jgi:FAD-dependent halogenase